MPPHEILHLTDQQLESLAPPAPNISSFSDCRCRLGLHDKTAVLKYGLNLLQSFLSCNKIALKPIFINIDQDADTTDIKILAKEKFEELKFKINSIYSEAVASNLHIYKKFERRELQIATFMLFEATWFYQQLCNLQKNLIKLFFKNLLFECKFEK